MNKKIKNLLLVGAAFAGLIGTAVSCQDYETDINDLKQQISELRDTRLAEISSQIAAINTSLSDLKAVDEGLKTQISGLKTDLATAKSDLEAKINAGDATLQGEIDELNTKIKDLETRIASLESAKAKMEVAIAEIKEQLPTFETISHAEATYATKEYVLNVEQALSEAIAACVSSEEFYKTLKGYVELKDFNAHLKDYADLKDFVGQINSALTNLASSMEEEVSGMIMRALESYYDAATIDALIGNFTEVYGENSSITAQINNLWTSYSELPGFIDENINFAIEEACANDGIISKTINEKIEAAINQVQATIENIVTVIWGMQIDVQGLIDQVQSIAYVPTHRDHKARVDYLVNEDGEFVAMGVANMEYQIQPTEAAQDIVAAWKAENGILSYYTVEVKSETPSLVIENVKLGTEPGRIIVTARPENFDMSFCGMSYSESDLPQALSYDAAGASYSVALKLENVVKVAPEAAPYEEEANEDNRVDSNVKNNLTSEFVNLVAEPSQFQGLVLVGKNAEGEDVILSDGDTKYYELDYTELDATIELLKGYEPKIVVNAELVDTASARILYNIHVSGVACEHKAYKNKGTVLAETFAEAGFTLAEGKEAVCDEVVGIDAETIKPEMRDNTVKSTHVYTLAGVKDPTVTYTYNTEVKLVKTHRTLTLEPAEKYWTYSEFKEKGLAYEGDKASMDFQLKLSQIGPDGKTLEGCPSLNDIIHYFYKYTQKDAIVKDKDGNVVEGVNAKIKGDLIAKDSITVTITGYEFGNEYEIEIPTELQYLNVEVLFKANFIDLPKEITYEYNDGEVQDIDYVWGESTVIAGPVENPLEALYAQVDKHFATTAELKEYVKLQQPIAVAEPEIKLGSNQFVFKAWKGETRVTSATHSWGNTTSPKTYTDLFGLYTLEELTSYIKKSDITTATDEFKLESTIATVNDMTIKFTGDVRVKMPAYSIRHNAGYVAGSEARWTSEVKPVWSPDGKDAPVSAFSVEKINLRSAFFLVGEDGKDIIDPSKVGAELTFAFADPTEVGAGITIINGYELNYMDKDDDVKVAGTLTVGGIEIPAAFAKYEEYYVKKYDPIKEFTVLHTVVPIDVNSLQESWTENIFKQLSLTDKRDKELIEHSSEKTNIWVIGDGNNGFTTSAETNKVYGINDVDFELVSVTYCDAENSSAKADLYDTGFIKFEATGANAGEITFDGMNKLNLTNDVEVTIKAVVSYPWSSKEGFVTYHIKKADL